jgi:hypothetical protein
MIWVGAAFCRRVAPPLPLLPRRGGLAGLDLMAARDSGSAAASPSIDAWRTRLLTWIIAAAMSGRPEAVTFRARQGVADRSILNPIHQMPGPIT